MTWSTKTFFRLAGIVFFAAMVLQAIFMARYVHTVTNVAEQMTVTMRGISTGAITSATWYAGVFQPILIGVVGLLVGYALGEAAGQLTRRDPPQSDAATP